MPPAAATTASPRAGAVTPARPPSHIRRLSGQHTTPSPQSTTAATANAATGVRLGLAVSPTDASPISALSRPTPPTRMRPKRPSNPLAPSTANNTTAFAATTSRARIHHDKEHHESTSVLLSSGRASPERYTGTVEDRTEDELQRASRQALQDALRREWTDREKLLSQLEHLDTSTRVHEERSDELCKANEALQAKYDLAFNEQSAFEAELEAANDRVDRLRSQLADAERVHRQGQRRYADQEKAFEAERMVHHAEQQHLHQRLKSVSAELMARSGNGEPHEALQEELMTLTVSHQTLVAQLTTLADELHEVKADNGRLQEENDSWQLLIEERTLAGTMRGGLLLPNPDGTTPSPSSIHRPEPNSLDTLEEQMEMDELHEDLDMQQPIFDAADRILSQSLNRGTSPTTMGGTLAMELDNAGAEAEIKKLKEDNKALSLYCSKILNRIIAQPGYEHVLSVDYRTRRATNRQANGKPRPSIEELAKQMEENGPPPLPELAPIPAPIPVPAPVVAKKARPQSMINPSPAPVAAEPAATSTVKKEERKSRRTFSIDFRALGFGGEKQPEVKGPQLKPLHLASRAVSASHTANSPSLSGSSLPKPVSPPTAPSPTISLARKLEPTEEDEEDRRERHRMEATLKLMGIDRTPDPAEHTESPLDKVPPMAAPAPESAPAASTGVGGWLARRLSRATAPTTPIAVSPTVPENGTTPLARLSATIGRGDDPILQGLVDLSDRPEDPEAAAAALRAYDAREREQARLLAEGKSMSAYTSPPKLSRRPMSGASTSSGTGSSTPSTASVISNGSGGVGVGLGLNGDGSVLPDRKARESISTLWSIGSSRPSLDIERS